jgi:hypothetical protein
MTGDLVQAMMLDALADMRGLTDPELAAWAT